jgi:hypothetical protein
MDLLHHPMGECVEAFRREDLSTAENPKEKVGIELQSGRHASVASPEMAPGLGIINAAANAFDEIGALHF